MEEFIIIYIIGVIASFILFYDFFWNGLWERHYIIIILTALCSWFGIVIFLPLYWHIYFAYFKMKYSNKTKYKICKVFTSRLFGVEKDGKYNVIDANGHLLLDSDNTDEWFDIIQFLNDYAFKVMRNNKIDILSINGRLLFKDNGIHFRVNKIKALPNAGYYHIKSTDEDKENIISIGGTIMMEWCKKIQYMKLESKPNLMNRDCEIHNLGADVYVRLDPSYEFLFLGYNN